MSRITRASVILAIFGLATAACGSTESIDGQTTLTALDPSVVAPVVGDGGASELADAGSTGKLADAGSLPVTPITITTGSLRIKIEGLQSTNGKFAWALFNEAGSSGFPDGARYREARIVPPAKSFELNFEQLPPGRYALSVYHDVDSNDELNKGVFGQPTERWGSTNNVTHTFSGPTFDESAVDVTKGFRTTTKVVLHD